MAIIDEKQRDMATSIGMIMSDDVIVSCLLLIIKRIDWIPDRLRMTIRSLSQMNR